MRFLRLTECPGWRAVSSVKLKTDKIAHPAARRVYLVNGDQAKDNRLPK
jgi:hypothetical protein